MQPKSLSMCAAPATRFYGFLTCRNGADSHESFYHKSALRTMGPRSVRLEAMRRDYVVRAGKIYEDVDGENYLARTVYEAEELIDIGVLDSDGNKVMARRRIDPVGFVRWSDK